MSKKLEEIELRSEQVQDILSYVPHWMIRYGNILFLGIIILFFSLSWLIKYPDVITAEALVTTLIPPQKEYAKISSRIDSVFVENNQVINKNTILATLENTANFKDIQALKHIIDTIKPNNESFYFPIDNLPILFLGEVDSDFALFENYYSQYTLNRDLQPFSNDALANKNSMSELKNRLQNAKAQLIINQTELDFAKSNLKRHETLFNKGVISKLEYENKQIQYAQSQRNFKNFESSISQIRESISNANKTTKGTEITKTREEIKLLKNVLQAFNQLKNAIHSWEQKYVLKSNIKGKVSFLHFWSANQNVTVGDLVFTIIPTENLDYIAKLKTPIQNSGKLKVGQQVNISVQNYPEAEFGFLPGTINHISIIPDSKGFYLLDVKLPEKLITSYNKEIDFKQEMLGRAEIITEDLRLLERFFYEIKDIFK
ncbi:HlyD family efflux transporter periplasmic adaptor subunit [Bizionia argentinensis JUB59]|uniref:HlyD family efflux transporter periplasmic adaptor subunit n=1 Tax=Bizionia argentinensis JUB59 TaxID=1046627 RepID=G2EBP0_9FLAO|nr:HlyD family efflux transporter periplasmic adaptor subunit [Bizionia argentinensis]EGV44197.1 HlyD family efflux transporter periplasmic adaptor subunit [Bizionia argentinensis JUB59]